jgi:hypothetical protein
MIKIFRDFRQFSEIKKNPNDIIQFLQKLAAFGTKSAIFMPIFFQITTLIRVFMLFSTLKCCLGSVEHIKFQFICG